MYPHERSLVERLADEPFALLGINSDGNLDALQDTLREENITWRSWYDQSTSGPIATAWNVSGWPTIYVLDADGVIRFKDVRGDDLDKAIDTLLAEFEGKGDGK